MSDQPEEAEKQAQDNKAEDKPQDPSPAAEGSKDQAEKAEDSKDAPAEDSKEAAAAEPPAKDGEDKPKDAEDAKGSEVKPPAEAKPAEGSKEEDKKDAPEADSQSPAKGSKSGELSADTKADEKPTEEAKSDQSPAETKADDKKPVEKSKVEESKDDAAKEGDKAPADSKKRKKRKKKKTAEGEEAEGDESESEEEVLMGENEFYPDNYVDKELEDSPIPKKYSRYHGVYGMESYKRFNFHLIEPHVLLYANGNTYQFYDMTDKTRKIYFGKDTDGIGSIAVHPTRKYFAVAEKGTMPNIYIYSYPDLRLYRICKGGTEKAYSHVEFSLSGEKLASVGSAPDYTITVWNWKAQKVILKSKAFSQEVYRVSFSPYTDGVLVSSGMGHIKFWKMANTFTGLKLKGELGKYGKLELSDVTGFRELPDGKIVSGTEYGTMILWEGINIKAHLVQDIESMKSCHDGFIEIIILQGETFITAGSDGYIKFWNFQDIDTAEFTDEQLEFAIKPIREILVAHDDGTPAHINQMLKEGGKWILGDARGKTWEINLDTEEKTEIMNYHSGAIADLGVCERKNVAVTLGSDGVLKCWDFINEKEMFKIENPGSGTCLDWLPYTESNKGRVLACGYSNGLVRLFLIEQDSFRLLNAVKALDSPISCVKYSPDGTMIVAAGEDGSIFYFATEFEKYDWLEPICMIQLEAGINSFTWHNTSTKILVACKNGRVYEIEKPKKENLDVKESFLVELPMKWWQIKMLEFQMKKAKIDEAEMEKIRSMRLRGELPDEDEEEEEEDWDPDTINTVTYTNDDSGRFIVTAGGLYVGYYYICEFGKERPIKAIEMIKNVDCSYLSYSISGEFLIAGCNNGSYLIWTVENEKKFMEVKMHDGSRGAISSAKLNYKENYALSVGHDGILNVQNINKEAIKMYAQAMIPGEDVEFVSEMDGFETMETEQPIKAREDASEDIIDPEALSIQEQKLRTEEFWRMKKAEERKTEVREKIQLLREQFEKLRDLNLNEDQWIQLTEQEFNVDPEFFEMLETQNQEKKAITKKEVAWGVEYRKVALEKLWSVFFDDFEYKRFTVKAIKTEAFVSTFRVKKMSKFLVENIQRFKEMIEKEYHPQSGSDDDLQSQGSSQADEGIGADNPSKMRQTQPAQYQAQNQQNKKKKTEAELKREERTRQREERKRELDRHEKEEQKLNIEDPEDIKRLQEAKESFGDYKLKMSDDYIVPEEQRVNAEKKRQQMILLENSIFNLKVDFNKNLEDLKQNRKIEIIELAKRSNKRILEINEELGIEEELFFPTIDEAVEYPEKQYEVTMEDIINFVHKKAKDSSGPAKSSMFGSSKKDEKVVSPEQKLANEFEKAYRKEQKQSEKVEDAEYIPSFPESRTRPESNMTEVDKEMQEIRHIELEYEKSQIKEELEQKIQDFDDTIADLQKEKYRLESDLKQAEMKLITYYEELIILSGMESRDKELTDSLAK